MMKAKALMEIMARRGEQLKAAEQPTRWKHEEVKGEVSLAKTGPGEMEIGFDLSPMRVLRWDQAADLANWILKMVGEED